MSLPTPPGNKSVMTTGRFAGFFGALLAATGLLFLLVFGACAGLCLFDSGGIPARRAEREVFEIALAGFAVGAILFGVGLWLRQRRRRVNGSPDSQ